MKYFHSFNISQLFQDLNDIFLFTFIRDPIDHVLSAYFEALLRSKKLKQKLKSGKYKKNPFKLFNDVLKEMIKRQNEQNKILNFTKNNSYIGVGWNRMGKSKVTDFEYPYYHDMHLRPQTSYLLNSQWKFFNLNYIGNLNNITSELYYMINQFFTHHGYSKMDYNTYNSTYLVHKRNHNDIKYNKGISKIKRNMLNDTHIQMICELYWIDYVCINGLHVPKQCDRQSLIQKYKHKVHVS